MIITAELLNTWLGKWEPTWLLLVLSFEALLGLATFIILVIEYNYDLQFNQAMKASRREKRRKSYEFEHLNEGEHK